MKTQITFKSCLADRTVKDMRASVAHGVLLHPTEERCIMPTEVYHIKSYYNIILD